MSQVIINVESNEITSRVFGCFDANIKAIERAFDVRISNRNQESGDGDAIVAAVGTGGGVDGGEPDAVAAQGLDVVQLFIDTPQVAHAVAVTVLEAARPDLIEYHILVPAVSCHFGHSFLLWYCITALCFRHGKSR